MKIALATLCLLAVALLFMSCGGQDTESRSDSVEHAAPAQHAEHPHSTDHPTHTHAANDDGLVLNDGKKWEMDAHTRDSFTRMADSFVNADVAALGTDGLKLAGAGLKKDLDGLIQGCTMTGPDHDQLHVYLMGYIPAVAALQETGGVDDARKVQHYLSIYGDYFE